VAGVSDAIERDTPLLVVDLDAVDGNIRRLQAHCDAQGFVCRPHIKTHKLPQIAWLQLRAGAIGITCQKLGEAEVMADAGIDDILLSFPIVGERKLARLARLARRVNLRVVGDDGDACRQLSRALEPQDARVGVLVECDTGFNRTGVQTPEDAAALGTLVASLPALRFDGLMTYPTPADDGAWVRAARSACELAGLDVSITSGGGTPTAFTTTSRSGLSELRAGTYVYGDRACIANGSVRLEDCALRIRATVVSRPTKGRVILDAGSKALTSDPVEAEGSGFGLIVGHPRANIYELSEEHGHVDIADDPNAWAIGDIVEIIPNHACGATNLYDFALVYRGGRFVASWSIAARGRSR
jgi:D-serine deaminase-like pyridoxal phosphate-dependent protein